ncbi:MAG TPA: HAMP domain-containing sensor histidine kinase, partial [Aeromicrobium sp.]|nr:HAMP domain-containing sensor histidine kinase [Aeromicrobium sp.]
RLANGQSIDEEVLASALEATDGAIYRAADGTQVRSGVVDTNPERSIVERRLLDDGSQLVVTRDRGVISDAVQSALVPMIVLGLSLAAVSSVAAFVLAGRATRTFRQLAFAAEDLGNGHFDLDVPEKGVPEALAIGRALTGAADRIEDMVRREREFSVNASHQLRTPITALRLELEDLTYWPQTPPEVADHLRASIGELDRLTASIDDLLDLARQQRRSDDEDVDLTEFVSTAADRWRRSLSADGRDITVKGPTPLPIRIASGPVAQILDVLIDNARVHGSGAVSITTAADEAHATVRVSDEGIRTIGNEVFGRGTSSRAHDGTGNGIGLAVASDLAESVGAHLTLDPRASTATFELLLPR